LFYFSQLKENESGDIEAEPNKAEEEEEQSSEVPPEDEEDDPEVLKLLLEQEREALVEQVRIIRFDNKNCMYAITIFEYNLPNYISSTLRQFY